MIARSLAPLLLTLALTLTARAQDGSREAPRGPDVLMLAQQLEPTVRASDGVELKGSGSASLPSWAVFGAKHGMAAYPYGRELLIIHAGKQPLYAIYRHTARGLLLREVGLWMPGNHAGPVADIDGDGKLDVALIRRKGGGDSMSLELSFARRLARGWDIEWRDPVTIIPKCRSAYTAVADADGDGRPDLLHHHAGYGGRFTTQVMRRTIDRKGALGPPQRALRTPHSATSMSVADLNGDGKPDLLLSPDDDAPDARLLMFAPGNGDGTFGATKLAANLWPKRKRPGADTLSASARVIDANGDGKPDLLAYCNDIRGRQRHHRLLLGQGDGTMSLAATWSSCGVKDRHVPVVLVREKLPARPAVEAPSAEAAAKLWADLASERPGHAARTINRLLALSPAQLIGVLGERIAQAEVKAVEQQPEGEDEVAKLIALLDHPRWKVRQDATTALIARGVAVRPRIEAALRADPKPEAKQRLELVLERLRDGQAERQVEVKDLRGLRALLVIEHVARAVGAEQAKPLLALLERAAASEQNPHRAFARRAALRLRP